MHKKCQMFVAHEENRMHMTENLTSIKYSPNQDLDLEAMNNLLLWITYFKIRDLEDRTEVGWPIKSGYYVTYVIATMYIFCTTIYSILY